MFSFVKFLYFCKLKYRWNLSYKYFHTIFFQSNKKVFLTRLSNDQRNPVYIFLRHRSDRKGAKNSAPSGRGRRADHRSSARNEQGVRRGHPRSEAAQGAGRSGWEAEETARLQSVLVGNCKFVITLVVWQQKIVDIN